MPRTRRAQARRVRPARVRVDELVVERGLAASRAEATRLIMAGRVRLAGVAADKGGRLTRSDVPLELTASVPYVGRGGEKLAAALAAFAVSVAGRVCLDVGASTGGFTDCLLQAGARWVYAVDVGHGQLHPRVRSDGRVTVLEGVNARDLDPGGFVESPSLACIDVSFISLEKVLPAVTGCLGSSGPEEGCEIIALVKPQFEVGRGEVGKGGVVRDGQRHRAVVLRVAGFAAAHGLEPIAVTASPLRGPKGNREFFLHLRRRPAAGVAAGVLAAAVDAALAAP